jgi:hypothetical protein
MAVRVYLGARHRIALGAADTPNRRVLPYASDTSHQVLPRSAYSTNTGSRWLISAQRSPLGSIT